MYIKELNKHIQLSHDLFCALGMAKINRTFTAGEILRISDIVINDPDANKKITEAIEFAIDKYLDYESIVDDNFSYATD